MAKKKLDIYILEYNRIFILYKEKLIVESKLSMNNKILKKEKIIEKQLYQKLYTPISANIMVIIYFLRKYFA